MRFGILTRARKQGIVSTVCKRWNGGDDRMRKLSDVLCDDHDPDSAALVCGPDIRELTFGQLKEESRKLATVLCENNVVSGDRIGLMLPKREEYFVACVAAARLGATVLPLFTAFEEQATSIRTSAARPTVIITTDSHRYKFTRTEATFITISEGGRQLANATDINYEESLRAAGELSLTDHNQFPELSSPMAMIFTSGTTGNPKGVPIPVRALNSFRTYLETGLGVAKSSNYWNIADPGWAYGLYYSIYAPLSRGVTSRFLNAPFTTKTTLDFMSSQRITHFAAAPTVYRTLRKDGVGDYAAVLDDSFCLECVSSAGEPLTPSVCKWFEETFKTQILNHYGQTENGMMCLYPHSHNNEPLFLRADGASAASMGPSMNGFTMIVVDDNLNPIETPGEVGELAIDVPNSPDFWFDGYFQKDRSFGDTYTTGDRGSFEYVGDTTEKHFVYEGRKDDVITTAGYRVGPSDIEDCIMQLPFVHECAAVGVPHEIKGHSIKVFIVTGGESASPSDILTAVRDHVKSKLAKHIVPSEVELVDSLPKTDSGKIKRFELRRAEREG